MINDKSIAAEISETMLNVSGQLNNSGFLVQEKCSGEEFAAYRQACGEIMGSILFEVLNPLYERHPDLKPDEF